MSSAHPPEPELELDEFDDPPQPPPNHDVVWPEVTVRGVFRGLAVVLFIAALAVGGYALAGSSWPVLWFCGFVAVYAVGLMLFLAPEDVS